MVRGNDTAEEADRFKVWLAAGVVIEDPMALEGLCARVDRDAVPVSGIPFDTQRTTNEKADCALCGRSRNHFKGFVVTFLDDSRAIIGKDCGEDKLFAQGAWKDMAASAERRKRQVIYDNRSAPATAAIDALFPLLSACELGVKPLGDFLASVSEELSALYSALDAAEKRDGVLVRTVERPVGATNRNGDTYTQFIQELRQFGTVPSFVPLRGGGIRGNLVAIRKGLEATKAQLAVEDVTLEQQSAAFVKLNRLGAQFRQLHSEAERARTFLMPGFWEGMCKWGNADSYRQGNYKVVSKRKVRHADAEWVYGEATLPPLLTYDLSAFDSVRAHWPRL